MAPEAIRVLERLNKLGYDAFLVGGAVRDLYLGKKPKDYDIATNARPSRLKKIFRNCRIIGRRFRIAHVYFDNGMILEVATFRRSPKESDSEDDSGIVRGESGIIVRDNEYGTPGEDASRRDLTINGLFYDLKTFSIIDYVGGVEDLQRGVVRMINDPDVSFTEDPVRMIRALRHAARTDFRVDDASLESIYRHRYEIADANPSRLLEEVLKDLRSGYSKPHFEAMMETHLFDALLPHLAEQLRETGPDHPLWARLRALDEWSRDGIQLTSPIYLCVLFHTTIFDDAALWNGRERNPPDVWRYASHNFRRNLDTLRVSRRDTERVLQVVISFRKLQQSLERKRMNNAFLSKVYMEDALTFLRLECLAKNESTELVDSWIDKARELRKQSREAREATQGGEGEERPKRPRRRRRRRRKPKE